MPRGLILLFLVLAGVIAPHAFSLGGVEATFQLRLKLGSSQVCCSVVSGFVSMSRRRCEREKPWEKLEMTTRYRPDPQDAQRSEMPQGAEC